MSYKISFFGAKPYDISSFDQVNKDNSMTNAGVMTVKKDLKQIEIINK